MDSQPVVIAEDVQRHRVLWDLEQLLILLAAVLGVKLVGILLDAGRAQSGMSWLGCWVDWLLEAVFFVIFDLAVALAEVR